MQDNPDLANLSHQVILENTPQGLRIQLVDQDGRPMFQPGSNQPMPYAKKLLAAVGGIVSQLPNRVSITGHTGGNDVNATGSAWELSAYRANQARAVLQAGGLGSDRIYEVGWQGRLRAAVAGGPQCQRQPPAFDPADARSPAGPDQYRAELTCGLLVTPAPCRKTQRAGRRYNPASLARDAPYLPRRAAQASET